MAANPKLYCSSSPCFSNIDENELKIVTKKCSMQSLNTINGVIYKVSVHGLRRDRTKAHILWNSVITMIILKGFKKYTILLKLLV